MATKGKGVSAKREFTKIDGAKLRTVLKENKTNATQMSEMIGRDRSYIHYCITSEQMPTNVLNLVCRLLNIEAEDLLPEPEKPVETAEIGLKQDDTPSAPAQQIDFSVISNLVTAAMKPTNDMLLTLSKEIMDLRRDISTLKRTTEEGVVWQESVAENLEKATNAINTIKLQNARIKDALGIGEVQNPAGKQPVNEQKGSK